MPRPKPDPEQVAYAQQRVREGASVRDISQEFKELGFSVSPITVSRWARQTVGGAVVSGVQTVPRPTLAQALAQRPAPAPSPPVNTSDTIGTLRGLLESFMADANRERAGNPKLATTLARSATAVLDQIRKIEAAKAEDLTMLRISRAEIEEARVAALERFKAICERPLMCSRCSRELSIAWGEAHEKVAEAERSEGE